MQELTAGGWLLTPQPASQSFLEEGSGQRSSASVIGMVCVRVDVRVVHVFAGKLELSSIVDRNEGFWKLFLKAVSTP